MRAAAGLPSTRPTAATLTPRGRALAIGLLSMAQFVVALDYYLANVSLPVIREDLGFAPGGVHWVVSGYALGFAGFLLLGGRAADVYGRSRMFTVGLGLSLVSSAGAALVTGPATLVAARVVQGIGAALLVPAAISLIINLCADEHERARAMGRLGALGSLGGAGGVLVGGLLTDALGWRAIFWAKVPMVALVILLTPLLVPRRSRPRSALPLDVGGAVTATAGLLAFLGAITAWERHGADSTTLALAGAAVLCLVAFAAIEHRTAAPLLQPRLLRRPPVAGASLLGFVLTGTFAPALLLVATYLQEVLGMSPSEVGFAFLPMSAVLLASTGGLSSRLIGRFGQRRTVLAALVPMASGIALLAALTAEGAGVVPVVAGLALAAAGAGTIFPVIMIAAASGTASADQGVASGLVNTTRQVGAAVGSAVLITVALSGDAAAGIGHAFLLALVAVAAAALTIPLLPGRGPRDGVHPASGPVTAPTP